MATQEVEVTTEQFMADLAKQAKKQRQMEIDSGILISQVDMARRLGKTRNAIYKSCRGHKIFSLLSPEGRPVYPAFFLQNKYHQPTLEAVCIALGDMEGAVKWGFFTSPHISLDSKTPLEALVAGQSAAVMEAALAFADE